MKSSNLGQMGAALLLAFGCGELASDGEQRDGGLGGAPPDDAAGSGGQATEPTTDARADAELDAGTLPPPVNGLVWLDGGIQAEHGWLCVTWVLEPNPVVPCNYLLPQHDGGTLDPFGRVVYAAGDVTQYLVVANEATTCDLGWRFIGDYAGIEICGSTCEVVKKDPGAQVSYVIECDMETP
jgi:hypothetical protein